MTTTFTQADSIQREDNPPTISGQGSSSQPPHVKHRKDFDPESDCGATTRNGTPCTHGQGFRTDHVGWGRCWLHGGKNQSSITHGQTRRSKQATLGERIDALLTDPDLLRVDKELALLKDHVNEYIHEKEIWDTLSDELKKKIPAPQVDLERIKLINVLTSTAFNMKFSNKFSIPISELQGIVVTIVNLFNTLVDKYNMPDAMKEELVLGLRGIRTLASPTASSTSDVQLHMAGSDRRLARRVIDESDFNEDD